jgi:hypothetical protein
MTCNGGSRQPTKWPLWNRYLGNAGYHRRVLVNPLGLGLEDAYVAGKVACAPWIVSVCCDNTNATLMWHLIVR